MTEQTKAVFENPQLLRKKLGEFLDTSDSVKIEKFAVVAEKAFSKGGKTGLKFVVSWSWWSLFFGILPLVRRKCYLYSFIMCLLCMIFSTILVACTYKYLIITRFKNSLNVGDEKFYKMSGTSILAVFVVLFIPVLITLIFVVIPRLSSNKYDVEVLTTITNIKTLISDFGAFYAVNSNFSGTKFKDITNIKLSNNNIMALENETFIEIGGTDCISVKLTNESSNYTLKIYQKENIGSICKNVLETESVKALLGNIIIGKSKIEENQEQIWDDFEFGENAYKKKDYKKAFEFYKKSCDSKNFAGCHRLGNLYNNGKGVEKDYKMAADSHEKACNGGIIGSCYNLGIMYYNGVGVEQSYKKAFDLWKKSCESNDEQTASRACNNLGILYDNGTGVRINKEKAKEYYGKSCDLGEEEGCKNYREFD